MLVSFLRVSIPADILAHIATEERHTFVADCLCDAGILKPIDLGFMEYMENASVIGILGTDYTEADTAILFASIKSAARA